MPVDRPKFSEWLEPNRGRVPVEVHRDEILRTNEGLRRLQGIPEGCTESRQFGGIFFKKVGVYGFYFAYDGKGNLMFSMYERDGKVLNIDTFHRDFFVFDLYNSYAFVFTCDILPRLAARKFLVDIWENK